jgi:hypothetical protein
VELRRSWTERPWRFVAIAAAIVAAIALWALYLRMADVRGASVCRQAYAAARTAADSALVDAQGTGAAMSRLDASYNVSCGELRMRGELR